MHQHAPSPTTATNVSNQYDNGRLQPPETTSTIAWDHLLVELAAGGTFWLTTIDASGHPHTRPVLAVQTHGHIYISSSRSAVKSAALGAGGPTSLATSRPGIDIVWCGASRPVVDSDELHLVADAFRSIHGWDVTVDGDALRAPYGAPTAGPPPYDVFAIPPHVVHAIGTGAPFTGRSTRWTFSDNGPADRLGSIVVAGHLRVAAGRRHSYLETCRHTVQAARTTEGCLDFAVSADLVDPDRVNIYERWTDRGSLHRFRADGPSDDQSAALIDASVDEFHTPA